MQQQGIKLASSKELWEVLNHRLDMRVDQIQYKSWLKSVGRMGRQKQLQNFYSLVYERVSLLFFLYELIYLDLDEQVLLGFNLDHFWASGSTFISSAYQLVNPFQPIQLVTQLFLSIGDILSTMAQFGFSIIKSSVYTLVFPMCLLSSLLAYLKSFLPLILLLIIGYLSLTFKKHNKISPTSGRTRTGQGKTQQSLVDMITNLASLVAIMIVQIAAGLILELLIAPVWIIEVMLICLFMCLSGGESEILAALVVAHMGKMSIVKSVFLLILTNLFKGNRISIQPSFQDGSNQLRNPSVLTLLILHFLLLLFTGSHTMFSILVACITLVRLIQALDSQCAHFKRIPQKQPKLSQNCTQILQDVKSLWDVSLPIKQYH